METVWVGNYWLSFLYQTTDCAVAPLFSSDEYSTKQCEISGENSNMHGWLSSEWVGYFTAEQSNQCEFLGYHCVEKFIC